MTGSKVKITIRQVEAPSEEKVKENEEDISEFDLFE